MNLTACHAARVPRVKSRDATERRLLAPEGSLLAASEQVDSIQAGESDSDIHSGSKIRSMVAIPVSLRRLNF